MDVCHLQRNHAWFNIAKYYYNISIIIDCISIDYRCVTSFQPCVVFTDLKLLMLVIYLSIKFKHSVEHSLVIFDLYDHQNYRYTNYVYMLYDIESLNYFGTKEPPY